MNANAIAGAEGFYHVVKSQNAPARIVTMSIDKMNGHVAAFLAPVLDQGINQRQDFPQCEGGALRKQTDADWAGFVDIVVAESGAGNMIAAVVNRRRV